MKLRNLNAAIRKHSGAIGLVWNSPNGPVVIETGKTSLLAGLKAGFGEDATIETGLKISEAGVLIGDAAAGADVRNVADIVIGRPFVAVSMDQAISHIDEELRDEEDLLLDDDGEEDLLLDDDGEDATDDEFDGLLD